MISWTALAIALGLGSFVQPVTNLDIPYFQNNPEVMRKTLERCHSDYELARTVECENAEAAGTLSLGRPLSSWRPDQMPLLMPPEKKQRQPKSNPTPPVPEIAKGKEFGV